MIAFGGGGGGGASAEEVEEIVDDKIGTPSTTGTVTSGTGTMDLQTTSVTLILVKLLQVQTQ